METMRRQFSPVALKKIINLVMDPHQAKVIRMYPATHTTPVIQAAVAVAAKNTPVVVNVQKFMLSQDQEKARINP